MFLTKFKVIDAAINLDFETFKISESPEGITFRETTALEVTPKNPNSVKCSMEGSGVDSGVFELLDNKGTWKIQWKKPVDREETPRFLLLIACTDAKGKIVEGPAEISVIVEDINDNTPKFKDESLTVFLDKDSPIGTNFHQIIATDADSLVNSFGLAQVYKVVGSEEPAGERFKVFLNGSIQLLEYVNMTEKLVVTFQVYARDMELSPYGKQSETVVVTVEIGIPPKGLSLVVIAAIFCIVLAIAAIIGAIVANKMRKGQQQNKKTKKENSKRKKTKKPTKPNDAKSRDKISEKIDV